MCSCSKHWICKIMSPRWELLDTYFLPYRECFRSAGVLDLHTICADGSALFRPAGHHPYDYRSAEVLRRVVFERNHWIQTVPRWKVRGHFALRPGRLPAPRTVDLQQHVSQHFHILYLYVSWFLLCLRLRHALLQLQRLNVAETVQRVLIIDLLRRYRALKAFWISACGDRFAVFCCILMNKSSFLFMSTFRVFIKFRSSRF